MNLRVSRRVHYAVATTIGVLNTIGMFLVVFGAAAGGRHAVMLWPALALMAGGVLWLALLAGIRATEVDLPPWRTGLAAILTCFAGPVFPVLAIYLALRKENDKVAERSFKPWLQWFLLLVLPWLVIMAIRQATNTW